MANPLFIPIQFAKNGIKNVIQKVLQSSQDQEDATWNSGWGQITMIPKEDGGLAPKGQDFNGIFYTMSDHLVHRQNGQQILFSTDVVAEYGGYAKDSIVQSDDGLKHFRSLIDNNTFNPNTQSIANRWEIYAGAGSVPSASSTIAGVIRVINNLTSTDVGAALSANMGRILNDALGTKANLSDFGKSHSQNGYQKFPNGLILQWGVLSNVALNQTFHTASFPIAFPTNALNISATISAANTVNGSIAPMVKKGSVTRTYFQVAGDNSTDTTTGDISWFAIGY